MPYVRDGLCVYKQNPDGSKGKLEGCSVNEAKAKGHLRALYAHMPETKEASADVSQYNAHGPGGVLSAPGQSKRKKKKVINSMLTPKEFTEAFEVSEKDFSYAQAETWVFSDAAQALSYLMSVARQEISMQEADDSKEIITMMQDLIAFMSDQLDEATNAINEPVTDLSSYSIFKEAKDKELGGFLVTESDGTKHLPTRVNGKLDSRHLAAAKAALTSNYRGHAYAGPNKSEALSKLKKLYSEAGLDWAGKEFTENTTLISNKETDGKYRWTMITGSAFQDRDGEIIETKAFERDCDEMELTGDYGELLWWHCDGTLHATDKEARPYIPLGSCDTSFVYEELNIESGLYYSDVVGQYFTEHAKEFGASKSFWHKEDEPQDGVYYTYIRSKERSMLPRTKEANLLTRLFGGTKEKEMADNKERIAALTEKLGEEETNKILAQAKAMSDKAGEFLASKETKKKKTDEEDTETTPDDEKKEDSKMKEVTEQLVAVKESNDKLVLSLKEFTDALALQTKELEAAKDNINQLQGMVSTLYGFTPKGFAKFEASKEGKIAEQTEQQAKMTAKVKEAGQTADGFMGLTDWLVTGERA